MEENNKQKNTEANKPKIEVYEQKEEPITSDEIIQVKEEPMGDKPVEVPKEVEKPLVEEKPVEEAPKVEEKSEVQKEEPRVEEIREEKPVVVEKPKVEVIREPKEPLKKRILNFYDTKYKQLMIIPVVMLILAIVVISIQTATTGSFINKDVSLSGGVTLTITKEGEIDIISLERILESEFINNGISVRSINKGGTQIGVIIVSDIEGTNKAELDSFIKSVENNVGELKEGEYSIEVMGSSLGDSFFKETITALLIAFLLMSLVVFAYFRTFVPSLAVILSAFSDIIVTLAIVNLMGMKIGTGGIAAFLMLVGYSVDTDMLLTTRLLKRKEGTVFDRVISSIKTGMMMTVTTMSALIVAIIFVQSAVIRQIMIIVLIGLAVDIVNTWIQNVGILRYYLEKKKVKF